MHQPLCEISDRPLQRLRRRRESTPRRQVFDLRIFCGEMRTQQPVAFVAPASLEEARLDTYAGALHRNTEDVFLKHFPFQAVSVLGILAIFVPTVPILAATWVF